MRNLGKNDVFLDFSDRKSHMRKKIELNETTGIIRDQSEKKILTPHPPDIGAQNVVTL